MKAAEFILKEDRSYLCEAYQHRATVLVEQFGRTAAKSKLSVHQIFEMFEAVPAAAPAQPAGQEAAAVQQGSKILGQAKASLSQGIQRTGEQVQNFDQQFDAYATKLGQKFPSTTKAIHAFREWAEEHPVAEHAILFLMGVAASVSAPGVIGAAIAVGILTTGFKLIMGKKFSQSVKTGAAAGIIAGALGSAVHGIEALAHAHHVAPKTVAGIENLAHGGIEHVAGDTIGDLAASGIEAVGALAPTQSIRQAAASAPKLGRMY